MVGYLFFRLTKRSRACRSPADKACVQVISAPPSTGPDTADDDADDAVAGGGGGDSERVMLLAARTRHSNTLIATVVIIDGSGLGIGRDGEKV